MTQFEMHPNKESVHKEIGVTMAAIEMDTFCSGRVDGAEQRVKCLSQKEALGHNSPGCRREEQGRSEQ